MATKEKIQFARKLRAHSTTAEGKAWELLRNRRMLGLKFRRQHPIRGFIVDLYCHELRLVLEIDGAYHDDPERSEYDARRSNVLENLGLTILRLRNEDVSEKTLLRLLFPLSRMTGEGGRG